MKIALAGNPNVGKSTLFNALTGLRQHTGNWPGKTVGKVSGVATFRGHRVELIDLPGTYSLSGSSEDEQIAAEFIAHGEADCIIAVCDGSALERSMILALQILQRTNRVVLCVNLMDEASRRGIRVNADELERRLGIPVVLTSAGRRKGLEELMKRVMEENRASDPVSCTDPIRCAEELMRHCVHTEDKNENWRQVLDQILLSRRRGIPILLLLLFLIVWLTVWGANYPSRLLESVFEWGYGQLEPRLTQWPWWLSGILLDGVYVTTGRILSVMLPPMAIFFPLFTILEDVGYLPRMAILLDRPLCRCGGCGKQALTLCMGLGCNAVGVTGCRIIECPRQRLMAILTNAMVPCNGRFPALILLSSLFFPDAGAALIVAGCIMLGVLGAMVTTGVLSRTVLREENSTFLMELPPFRRPRFGQILVRSLFDRTLKVATRALIVAAPAGAVLWILAHTPLLGVLAQFLDPLGRMLGMNGILLLGFCLSLPANELLFPIVFMVYLGTENMDLSMLQNLGWTWRTAVCTMVFTLFHWPCSTTLITIYQETKSAAKTAAAFVLPTAVGMLLCLMLNVLFQNIGA